MHLFSQYFSRSLNKPPNANHMKRTIISMFISGAIVLSLPCFSQESNTSGANWNTVSETGGIKVSEMQGQLGTSPAVFFSFENTTKRPVTFTYIIKDRSGNVLHKAETISINSGETLNGKKDPSKNNSMSIRLAAGQDASDISVTITLVKNQTSNPNMNYEK